jgi:hypothetical protein
VVGKFIGLIFSINLFSLEWGIKNIPGALFSVRPVFYSEDILIASTYSDLVMFAIIIIGFSIVLMQALVFHDSHISPSLLSKLANKNLLGLVKSTFEIYHKAAVWTIFVWISVLLIFLNTLASKTELWVLVFALITTIALNVFLLRDVASEIELSKSGKNLSIGG